MSVFYHCPFCGGLAPQSLRPNFWQKVTPEESMRLHRLTRHIITESEFLKEFGNPDSELESAGSLWTPESEDKPSEILVYNRKLTFRHMSEIADVHVYINRYGKLTISFSGKRINPENPA